MPTFARARARMTLVEVDGRRALHLHSRDDGTTIGKELQPPVDLRQTPFLEWSWRAVALPAGGDSRRKRTDDQAAQVFVVWPRPPEPLRSRIIGYVWETTAPVGITAPSEKTGTVKYIVIRSGPAELGRWLTERRAVADDYRRLYGEEPPAPGAVALAIDSNDTHSVAESYIGPIRFVGP